jgi:outer membrane protein assembly factor BamB
MLPKALRTALIVAFGLHCGLSTVLIPTAEARRKKPPKTVEKAADGKATSQSADDGWQTSQGPGIPQTFKGTLSQPLLLDSAVVQLVPSEDGAFGLTRQGSVFRVKASGNSPSTVWRVAGVVNKQPDGLTLQGDTLWVSGGTQLMGLNAQTGAVRHTATLSVPARMVTLDATTLLLALDNGHLMAWGGQQPLWEVDLKSPLVSLPLVTPQGIYAADLQGITHKLDAKTGQVLWEFGLGGPYTASPVLTPDQQLLLLPSQVGTVFGLNPGNGQRVLSHTLPEGTPFLASGAVQNKSLIAADEDGLVFALECQSNRRLWQNRLRGRVSHDLLIAGPDVLITQEDGRLTALNLATGKMDWTAQIPGIIATMPVITRQQVWLGTVDGRLFWVN